METAGTGERAVRAPRRHDFVNRRNRSFDELSNPLDPVGSTGQPVGDVQRDPDHVADGVVLLGVDQPPNQLEARGRPATLVQQGRHLPPHLGGSGGAPAGDISPPSPQWTYVLRASTSPSPPRNSTSMEWDPGSRSGTRVNST